METPNANFIASVSKAPKTVMVWVSIKFPFFWDIILQFSQRKVSDPVFLQGQSLDPFFCIVFVIHRPKSLSIQ